MKAFRNLVMWVGLSLLAGCGSNSSQTHNPDLLDDKVTTQRVRAALHRGGAQFQGVTVHTSNGVVMLTGAVASPQERQQAESLARSVHRVSKLDDKILVQGQGPTRAP